MSIFVFTFEAIIEDLIYFFHNTIEGRNKIQNRIKFIMKYFPNRISKYLDQLNDICSVNIQEVTEFRIPHISNRDFAFFEPKEGVPKKIKYAKELTSKIMTPQLVKTTFDFVEEMIRDTQIRAVFKGSNMIRMVLYQEASIRDENFCSELVKNFPLSDIDFCSYGTGYSQKIHKMMHEVEFGIENLKFEIDGIDFESCYERTKYVHISDQVFIQRCEYKCTAYSHIQIEKEEIYDIFRLKIPFKWQKYRSYGEILDFVLSARSEPNVMPFKRSYLEEDMKLFR